MPKAARRPRQTHTPTQRHDPTSKPASSNSQSHLYTDDNPSTTLHGTGFSDGPKAEHTLALIAARSLTYQFQTVNTMYHRAAHHPARARTRGIQDAMRVFRAWLDDTYPAARARPAYKPLLSREFVSAHIPGLRRRGIDAAFADMYVALPKGKRLANVLLDDAQPAGPDWERARVDALDALVGGRTAPGEFVEGELWAEDGAMSELLARLVAWAWSPVPEKKLPKAPG